jgi:hypothetical protein
MTARGTFQKFYDQEELKGYLEAQLQAEAVPAGTGTFYVFKDEALLTSLGRLPGPDEFAGEEAVTKRFGSLKRALAVVHKATGTEEWDAIARCRREDLFVYLALARFRRRPPRTGLSHARRRPRRAGTIPSTRFWTWTRSRRMRDWRTSFRVPPP